MSPAGHHKIQLKDVLNFFEYEKVRAEMRGRVIALKRVRRVPVGEHLSFVFENRDTVLFQIQEMIRIEADRPARKRSRRSSTSTTRCCPEKARWRRRSLSKSPSRRRSSRRSTASSDWTSRASSRFPSAAAPTRLSSRPARAARTESPPCTIRFPVGPDGRGELAKGAPAELTLDHGDYSARARLSPETVEELRGDLEQE